MPIQSRIAILIKKNLSALLAIIGLIVFLVFMTRGSGKNKTEPGNHDIQEFQAINGKSAIVALRDMPEICSWPGTIRSRTATAIASKMTARVREIRVHAGALVRQGDTIALNHKVHIAGWQSKKKIAHKAANDI